MNKRFLSILIAVFGLMLASGSAFAQHGGGAHGGGSSGGWHGGGAGGGAWHGGGGTWHGGYNGWHGGWHGGYYGYRYPYYGGWGWYGLGVASGLWWGGWPYYYGAYGNPYYAGGYYGYPGYSQADTSVYVEQAPQAPANNYWYYCTDPAGYFPYVQNCNRAWMQVVPQNAPPPGSNYQ